MPVRLDERVLRGVGRFVASAQQTHGDVEQGTLISVHELFERRRFTLEATPHGRAIAFILIQIHRSHGEVGKLTSEIDRAGAKISSIG